MEPKEKPKPNEVVNFERSMDRIYRYRRAQKISMIFYWSELNNDQIELTLKLLSNPETFKQVIKNLFENQ